jgi:paraquat-inducible protein A
VIVTASPDNPLRACHCCGLVHTLPAVKRGTRAVCTRCGATIRNTRLVRTTGRAAAFALAALILYPLALFLPMLQIERLGQSHAASLWTGVVELLGEGHLLIGIVVLVCSVVAPILKIVAMLVLCSGDLVLRHHHRAMTYRIVEWIGRWGMLDVLLVAILVAVVKLGDWVTVSPEPGAAAFAGVVVFSLLSSAAFDPHAIWEIDS